MFRLYINGGGKNVVAWLALYVLVLAVCTRVTESARNLRPVIGIYAAPLYETTSTCNNTSKCDYVAASYVKWLEHAGAESIPIRYDSSDDEIDAIFSQINGVLFPGGGSETPNGARRVVKRVLEANDKGDYFPLWGTCLGFEWLVKIVSRQDSILDGGFDSENISLPLNLTPSVKMSRLLGPIIDSQSGTHRLRTSEAVAQLQSDLSNSENPPTMNNHQAGVTPSKFISNKQLSDMFTVLSTNMDRNGREFVSTIEAKKYPIYGTQWHPEKNNFEWGLNKDGLPYEDINHSPEAIFASQSLANYFVGESRRNSHQRRVNDSYTKLFWDFSISQVRAPEFEQIYLIHV